MKTAAALSLCFALLTSTLSAQEPSPAPTASPTVSIPPDSPKYGVYPIAYREIITRWLADRLLDANSAQLEWTEPKAGEVKTKTASAAGYSVEFRVNSRNKFGMYTGFQKYRVLIRNGEIVWADRVRE